MGFFLMVLERVKKRITLVLAKVDHGGAPGNRSRHQKAAALCGSPRLCPRLSLGSSSVLGQEAPPGCHRLYVAAAGRGADSYLRLPQTPTPGCPSDPTPPAGRPLSRNEPLPATARAAAFHKPHPPAGLSLRRQVHFPAEIHRPAPALSRPRIPLCLRWPCNRHSNTERWPWWSLSTEHPHKPILSAALPPPAPPALWIRAV